MKNVRMLLFMLLFLLLSQASFAAHDVVTFDDAHNELTRWSSDGGTQIWQTNTITHTASNLEVGPDGDIYMGAWTDDRVYKINKDTGDWVHVAHQQTTITDRTWDITFGNDIDNDGIADLYVASGSNKKILAYGSASGYAGTSEVVFADISTMLHRGTALDFGPDVTGDGIADLWVVDGDRNDGTNNAFIINGATGATYSSWDLDNVRVSKDIEVENGRVYISGSGRNEVHSFALDGTDEKWSGTGGISGTGMDYPTQIHLGLDNEWLVAQRFDGSLATHPSILKLNSDMTSTLGVWKELDGAFWTGVTTIVPEPATVSLLTLGTLGLLRRKRSA